MLPKNRQYATENVYGLKLDFDTKTRPEIYV
jgi:hypothetical protein